MNDPIFNKEDFKLCDVPVPKGYPQSQTHSGIALYDGNFYLTTSPYPGKKHSPIVLHIRSIIRKLSGGFLCNPKSGEVYENPCLYIGIGPKDEIPTKFKPLAVRPLMDIPEAVFGLPAYNSDPDVFVENGQFYIMNRAFYRTNVSKGKNESITDVFLIKGTAKYEKFKLESIKLIKEWEQPFVSPCLTKFRGKYVFTYLQSMSALDARTFDGLFVQEVNNIDELSENECYRKIQVHSDDMLPWHMSLFSYGDTLYTIIACVKNGDKTKKIWQMLGEFNRDITELTIYPTPLSDYNSYRGAACVRDDGLFILYSTVLWEFLKGTKSVDGRDVVVTKCMFADLLNRLRNNNHLV